MLQIAMWQKHSQSTVKGSSKHISYKSCLNKCICNCKCTVEVPYPTHEWQYRNAWKYGDSA